MTTAVEHDTDVERLRLGLPAHRVLVVDDNADTADSLAALLGQLGQATRRAYDGRTALLICAQFRPDVVFVDLVMPGMDGVEVAEAVRDMTGISARIFGMTGHGGDYVRDISATGSFDGHLVKPVELHSLLRVLRNL